MAIQVLSDLHLEAPKAYDVFEITPKAPYLALLGDIGNIVSHKDDCLAFLTQQLRQFRVVLFVPGNHEAYHSNWPETLKVLRAFEEAVRGNASIGDFVLLDRTSFRLPGSNTVILGCSLFSHVPKESHETVSFGLNDFFHTGDWDVDAHNEAHRRDLAWLNDEVAALEHADAEIIILTHWSPTRDVRAVDSRHAQSPITSAFSTDLSQEVCFKSPKTKIWAFGHTHFNCDFEMDRGADAQPLRIVANQRGYYFSQATGFDAEKVLEV
ncbi:Metallo-dependent phosphatase-like protein [Hypomontagnella monticulosa]|nr:Metallo-dependent phosphatase-like protein [Hypomontagnella monticulosa]